MTLRCTTCSSLAVLAVRPGSDDVIGAGIVLQRGEPARAWCAECWPMRPLADVLAPIVARARQRQPTPAERRDSKGSSRRPAGTAAVPPAVPAGEGVP